MLVKIKRLKEILVIRSVASLLCSLIFLLVYVFLNGISSFQFTKSQSPWAVIHAMIFKSDMIYKNYTSTVIVYVQILIFYTLLLLKNVIGCQHSKCVLFTTTNIYFRMSWCSACKSWLHFTSSSSLALYFVRHYELKLLILVVCHYVTQALSCLIADLI